MNDDLCDRNEVVWRDEPEPCCIHCAFVLRKNLNLAAFIAPLTFASAARRDAALSGGRNAAPCE
jgi:hypothetical protein